MHGYSFDRVRSSLQQARLVVDGFQDAGGRRDPLGKSFQRSMKRDSGPDRISHLGQRFRDELCKITLGWLAGLESSGGLGLAIDAIDAEGAPVLSVEVPCDEIPAISGVNE